MSVPSQGNHSLSESTFVKFLTFSRRAATFRREYDIAILQHFMCIGK